MSEGVVTREPKLEEVGGMSEEGIPSQLRAPPGILESPGRGIDSHGLGEMVGVVGPVVFVETVGFAFALEVAF